MSPKVEEFHVSVLCFHFQVKGLGMSNKRFTPKDSAKRPEGRAGRGRPGNVWQVTCDMGAGDPITFHQFHQLHW